MSIEEMYVKNVYNKIASEFDTTRYRPWTCVEEFLNTIPKGSIIGDIGCGNGKNMLYRKDCLNYGCDFSESLVNICLQKNLNVICGDILNIPYKNDSFDYTICIAVLHHLSTVEKRKKAIEELERVTKKGGKILVLVWAFEQEEQSRRKFTTQEIFVDWRDKQQNLLGKRYYYVFQKNELESLVDEKKVEKGFYEKGNWGIVFKRV